MTTDCNESAGEPRLGISTARLGLAAVLLLLAGGVLLDADRVSAAQAALDRAAHVAAIEAAAAPRAADRAHICRKRFDRTVWTETEVSVDDFSVTVDRDKDGRTATVSYDATVKLAVGRFFGVDQIEISGEAAVSAPEKQTTPTIP
jgi:uncharacterized membrane protein